MVAFQNRPIAFCHLILLVGMLMFPGIPAHGLSSPSSPEGAGLVRDWLDRTTTFYAEREELRIPRGSMWKHFVGNQRFLNMRTVNGVLPTAGDRVRAWEIGRARQLSSSFTGNGWFTIGPPNISGRIVDLKFHPTNPQVVYAAAASGGLWLSDDGGANWRTTTDDLPSLAIGAVCVVPSDPDIILAATGEGLNWSYVVFGAGIWRSTDGGESWSPTNLTHEVTDNHGFHVMEANPITGTILAGANDGLWRSTDDGATWTQVKIGGDYYDVKWKPGSATRVYAAKGSDSVGNNIKVSDDDGLTWTRAGFGQPPSSSISKTRIAVTDADPNVIFAHYGSSVTYGTLGIYRSVDNGVTWQARNTGLNISGGQGGYAVTIAVDPDDADRVIAGGIKLYLSTDGGSSFTETGGGNGLGDETAVHVDHHAVVWEPGSTSNVWVGTDGGAWRSTDNGDNWNARDDGLITTQYYDVCLDPGDPDFIMGGSQDNGLNWVETADTSWYPSTITIDGMACFVEPLAPNTIHSEYQMGGHVRSDDRGQSWQFTSNGLTGSSIPFAPLDLDPNRAGHLYTSTRDGIFRTDNGQDLWQFVDSHEATWISISPIDGDIVWTVNGNTTGTPVHVTTNDGVTWIPASAYGFAVGNETKIVAHPTDSATAFVTFAGYSGVAHVARTTDFGATWHDVSGDFPPDPANTMVIDPDDPTDWFAGTDTGVWRSTDGGATWLPAGTGFPNVVVYDLEIQRASRKLVAITYGRGTWEIDLAASTGTTLPTVPRNPDLMLDPPSPNPVGERLFIRFASRKGGRATLNIYDVRGRLVDRVAELTTADGIIRTVEWAPTEVAAGVYFAVLRSSSGSVSRKLVVEK